jgi:hypothetical protein
VAKQGSFKFERRTRNSPEAQTRPGSARRRSDRKASAPLLPARCGEGGVALAMLAPEDEQGCTVIGCRRGHHALLDYA